MTKRNNMDRAERTGLGIAILGHAALFAAISFSLMMPQEPFKSANPPIDVQLIDATALESAAPDPSPQSSPPPVAVAPVVEDIAVAPPPPSAVPAPKPVKTPPPQAVKKTAPPISKPKPAPRKSQLNIGVMSGISDAAKREAAARSGTGKGTAASGSGTPAVKTAAQLEASFIQNVFAKMKPYWKAPTGADAELLKTNLIIALNRDGSVANIKIVSQSGDNDSNRNLLKLHAERAESAVRRAAPFDFPIAHYAIWQTLGPITFDKKSR
ncbi:MAG: TonB C-terminal domain-containing protein [Chakrabartia sp.]